MPHVSTDALVLKSQPVGDRDRLLVLLTGELGVVRAFARGARSAKSKLSGATAQLVYGHYVLYRGKDAYSVDEAGAEQVHIELSRDLSRLALAQYLCELSMSLAPEESEAHDWLRLMRCALFLLERGGKDLRLVKCASELRLLTMSGYMPDILMCPECGAYEAAEMDFFPLDGTLLCSECRERMSREGVFLPLSTGALTAMRHLVFAELPKLYSFSVSESSLLQLSDACESYLISQLERSFATLEFYKSVTS